MSAVTQGSPIDADTVPCIYCVRPVPRVATIVRCEGCGATNPPHHTLWPEGMKRFVAVRLMREYVTQIRGIPSVIAQLKWMWILRAVFRGRNYDHGIVPMAANDTTIWNVAELELAKWKASGSPTSI